jgi:hypothetical protein
MRGALNPVIKNIVNYVGFFSLSLIEQGRPHHMREQRQMLQQACKHAFNRKNWEVGVCWNVLF